MGPSHSPIRIKQKENLAATRIAGDQDDQDLAGLDDDESDVALADMLSDDDEDECDADAIVDDVGCDGSDLDLADFLSDDDCDDNDCEEDEDILLADFGKTKASSQNITEPQRKLTTNASRIESTARTEGRRTAMNINTKNKCSNSNNNNSSISNISNNNSNNTNNTNNTNNNNTKSDNDDDDNGSVSSLELDDLFACSDEEEDEETRKQRKRIRRAKKQEKAGFGIAWNANDKARAQGGASETHSTVDIEHYSRIKLHTRVVPKDVIDKHLKHRQVATVATVNRHAAQQLKAEKAGTNPFSSRRAKAGAAVQDWVVIGAITRKGEARSTERGKPFRMVDIGDLGSSPHFVTVALFDDAFATRGKDPIGTVWMVLNPSVRAPHGRDKGMGWSEHSLSVNNGGQVAILGAALVSECKGLGCYLGVASTGTGYCQVHMRQRTSSIASGRAGLNSGGGLKRVAGGLNRIQTMNQNFQAHAKYNTVATNKLGVAPINVNGPSAVLGNRQNAGKFGVSNQRAPTVRLTGRAAVEAQAAKVHADKQARLKGMPGATNVPSYVKPRGVVPTKAASLHNNRPTLVGKSRPIGVGGVRNGGRPMLNARGHGVGGPSGVMVGTGSALRSMRGGGEMGRTQSATATGTGSGDSNRAMQYDHEIVARNERMKQNQIRMCAQQYHARTAKQLEASKASTASTSSSATTTGAKSRSPILGTVRPMPGRSRAGVGQSNGIDPAVLAFVNKKKKAAYACDPNDNTVNAGWALRNVGGSSASGGGNKRRRDGLQSLLAGGRGVGTSGGGGGMLLSKRSRGLGGLGGGGGLGGRRVVAPLANGMRRENVAALFATTTVTGHEHEVDAQDFENGMKKVGALQRQEAAVDKAMAKTFENIKAHFCYQCKCFYERHELVCQRRRHIVMPQAAVRYHYACTSCNRRTSVIGAKNGAAPVPALGCDSCGGRGYAPTSTQVINTRNLTHANDKSKEFRARGAEHEAFLRTST